MKIPFNRFIKARSTWLTLHLYLALTAGFLFALMGLTGSISVYREPLDELLNPLLVIEEPKGDYQSLDRIMAAVKAIHPDRYGTWTLEMPRSPNSMMTAWFEKPRETFFERYAPLMVSINPYTAEVVMSRFWGQTLTTWLLDLHTQLLLDQQGWNVVGILGFLLMFSIISGLYLWWPGLRKMVSALKIHHSAGLIRLLFDLHRLIGLFSAAVLLVLALTGFFLSFPEVTERLIGTSGMQHGETGRTIASTAIPNNHPTGLSAASFVAQGPFPKARLRRVTTPAGDTGIYRINLRQGFEINQRHPYTTVWVDRWSGQIKEVRNPTQFSKGETAATWIWPLHTGEAVGTTGRFIWFLAGQSLFFLYVSGLMRWLYQRGMLKDREVNFAALGPLCYRWGLLAYRMGLKFSHFLVLLVKKTKRYQPHILLAYSAVLQWIRQKVLALSNRQKRIGRNP